MKKNYLLCCLLVALATMFVSCDKEADNENMRTVSGTYTGDILAELYMPDYTIEQENIIYNEFLSGIQNSPALAADTLRNAKVQFLFTSDSKATICIDNLPSINFNIPFLFLDDDWEDVFPRENVYDKGAFADVFNMVKEHCIDSIYNSTWTPEEKNALTEKYYDFIELTAMLNDTITFSRIKTQPLTIRQKGSLYSTFDEEQNSVYERFTLESFDFERKSNIPEIMQYIKDNFLIYFNDAEKAKLKDIQEKLVFKGTVNDASGWCEFSYSNYRPYVGLTLTKATGILDVLTKALFGEQKDKDKKLWFEIFYQGTIDRMDSYEIVEDK